MNFFIITSVLIVSIGLVGSDILTQGMTIEEVNGGIKKFIFSGANSKLTIDGISYENIVPGPSFIIWNGEKIIEANIIVNDNGGVYIFGDSTITAPPNSAVFFDNKLKIVLGEGRDLITVILQRDSKLESPPILVDSVVELNCLEGCILPNGAEISGTVYYDKDGLVMDSRGSLEINGARVTTENSRSLFLNAEDFEISLKPGDSYIFMDSEGNIEANNFVTINTGGGLLLKSETGGRVVFKISENGIPEITGEAPFEIKINNGNEVLIINSVYNKEEDKDEIHIKTGNPEDNLEKNIPIPYDEINLKFYDTNGNLILKEHLFKMFEDGSFVVVPIVDGSSTPFVPLITRTPESPPKSGSTPTDLETFFNNLLEFLHKEGAQPTTKPERRSP